MNKHRNTIYVLLREPSYSEEGQHGQGVVLDSFATYKLAEERKGQIEQEYKDAKCFWDFTVIIQTSTYYDML